MKKVASEIKIAVIIFLIFFIVVITAIMGFRGFRDIVNEVSESARPEIKLSSLKQVLSDIAVAESSIKSYSLTHDSKYLSPFYKSVLTVDAKMEELKAAMEGSEDQKELLRRMNLLIDKKYALLNELLALHADENITDELTRISKKMQEETINTQLHKTRDQLKEDSVRAKEEKKRGFFKNLFGRKEKREARQATIPQDSVFRARLNQVQRKIQREIIKVNSQHLNEIKQIKETELLLTGKNEFLTEQIKLIATGIEDLEEKSIAGKIENAKKRAEETTELVGIFCGVAALLLLTVSLVIIKYVRSKNIFNRELSHAKEKAEDLARSREMFLANMSHEIRTPMNAISGFTQQLLHTKLSQDQREQLEIVGKSIDHLLDIINDILDYSKIGSGKFTFAKVNFHPGMIVDEVCQLLSPKLLHSPVELKIQTDSLRSWLNGDPVRLRQIILNLVGNAIKFTEKGEVSVTAREEDVDAHTIKLHLSISDTGIGIPKDKIDSVFRLFEQADDHVFLNQGGTGLGLPITKKLVELQGGSMQIESDQGQGTKINLEIPYIKGKETAINEKVRFDFQPGFGMGRSVKVLVADDNIYNRKLLIAILSRWQVDIKESRNGKEVLEAVQEAHFDIILMDILMPELNGIEATRAIRNLPDKARAAIPILVLTAAVDEEKRQQCVQAGVNSILRKPFKEYDLYTCMHSLLNNSGGYTTTQLQDSKETAHVNTFKGFSLEGLKAISVGNKVFYHEMIDLFIKSTQEGLAQMEIALQKNDFEALADYAHKIAPACRHMEAIELLELLKQIEGDIRVKGKTNEIHLTVRQAQKVSSEIINEMKKIIDSQN